MAQVMLFGMHTGTNRHRGTCKRNLDIHTQIHVGRQICKTIQLSVSKPEY